MTIRVWSGATQWRILSMVLAARTSGGRRQHRLITSQIAAISLPDVRTKRCGSVIIPPSKPTICSCYGAEQEFLMILTRYSTLLFLIISYIFKINATLNMTISRIHPWFQPIPLKKNFKIWLLSQEPWWRLSFVKPPVKYDLDRCREKCQKSASYFVCLYHKMDRTNLKKSQGRLAQ